MKVNGEARREELAVSLRGTLAHQYVLLNEHDPAKATVWIRQIVKDAFNKDPDLLVLVQLHQASGSKRYLIGRKDEHGSYPPDW